MCKSWIYIEALRSRISPVSTWRAYIQSIVQKKSDKSALICCDNIKTEFSKSTWQFSKPNDSPRIKCFRIHQTYASFCILIFHHEVIRTAGSFVVLTVAERVAFIIFLYISWSSCMNYSHSQLTGSASSKKIRLEWNNFIRSKMWPYREPARFLNSLSFQIKKVLKIACSIGNWSSPPWFDGLWFHCCLKYFESWLNWISFYFLKFSFSDVP